MAAQHVFSLQSEQILSFIPPGGNFQLMSYLIGTQNVFRLPPAQPPLPAERWRRRQEPKQTMGRQLENVKVEMPKTVLNCTLTSTQGKYSFKPVGKMLCWEVGKVDGAKLPNLKGSVSNVLLLI